jgi:hypothetical protein
MQRIATIGNALASTVREARNIIAGPHPAPRVFGVGAAKTGTHSLGDMFSDQVPSAHERDVEALINLLLDHGSGSDQLRRYLKRRDRRRRLWIDASQVNIYLIEDLEALFPGSLYVLTVRSPALWLRSKVDDMLRRETSPTWRRFRDYRFGEKAVAGTPDDELAKRDLYTVRGYLQYWRFAIETVLTHTSADRRMVVETSDLASRAAEIARFASLPYPDRLPVATHSFQNTTRSGVLEKLDRHYLAAQLEENVGPIARSVFPDWSAEGDLDRIFGRGSAS